MKNYSFILSETGSAEARDFYDKLSGWSLFRRRVSKPAELSLTQCFCFVLHWRGKQSLSNNSENCKSGTLFSWLSKRDREVENCLETVDIFSFQGHLWSYHPVAPNGTMLNTAQCFIVLHTVAQMKHLTADPTYCCFKFRLSLDGIVAFVGWLQASNWVVLLQHRTTTLSILFEKIIWN